ncbi:MAG: hypothetical protein U9Q23_03470 [Candidatus Bipolaricaulota bacterium]|nr:hypothetical protein [Candidatus Bipolaricaulota bacterium]
MRRVTYIVVFLALVLTPVLAGQAVDLEGKIGTGPSFAVVAEGDISSSLSVAFSFGMEYEEQTPSATIFGLAGKCYFAPKDSQFVPYLGVGGYLKILPDSTSEILVGGIAGARLNLFSNAYLSGEAIYYAPIAPITDIAAAYLRFYLGAGIHIPF